LDLLGEDVGVTGVPCGLGNHAQVDESQVHSADYVVFGDVVECESSCQFVRPSTCCRVFGDHLGEGFAGGHVEATVAADGMTVAGVSVDAAQCPLEPNAFSRSAVFDQRDGGGQRGDQVLAGLGVGEVFDGPHELSSVQRERVRQQLSFAAGERAAGIKCCGHSELLCVRGIFDDQFIRTDRG